MYLKNVNIIRLKSLSLVKKLALLYALSTIGILVSIFLFLYPTFIKLIQYGNEGISLQLVELCFERAIIALLLSSVFAIVFGYIIAKNGLNRLYQFSEKMEIITADSLSQRIEINDWPKELKNVGNKFNNMLDRLHISFAQLSQFSSDIAHELRGPLHNLRGMTELVLSGDKSNEEYRKILESNQDEYSHLTRLVESLLFLAQVDHGQITLNKTALSARNEIEKIADYFQAIADEKNISIIIEGDESIFIDQTLFKRIINNLLSNALRYTQNNGNIIIKIQALDDNNVTLSISDTGVGIGQEHVAKIFDRFYRVDHSRSMQSGGVGLGLAIVKSIVDLYKGRINITSELNVGTTIVLSLPK